MKVVPNTRRRQLLVAAIVAGLAVGSVGNAFGQTFPVGPIRLVVPFPAGGGTDLVARTVAQKLSETFNWNITVDNRSGAGGNIGVDFVAKSQPDGYTIVIGQTNNLVISPALYKSLRYDPVKDFEPVALIGSTPIAVATSVDSPYKKWADVVNASKKSPGSVTVGYSGNGTVAHLSVVMAENAADIKLQHVPYKGASQAMTDLMGGRIDLYMSTVPSLLGHVRNNKLRAIAVTSAERSSQLKDVETLAEAGVKNFDAVTWFGIMAPANTPPEVVKALNAAFNEVIKDPEVVTKLKAEGGNVLGGSSEEFAVFLKSEVPRWAKIVKDSGAEIQ